MPARSLRSLMILVVLAALLAPGAAASEQAKVKGLTPISGESPFPEGCDPVLRDAGAERRQDAEAEVTFAVNPANPQNMVAAWMQDYNQGVVTTSTHDGGRTWTDPTFPSGQTFCSGDEVFLGAFDPWLSIGRDGTVYLVSFSLSFERTRLQIHTSDDGGRTWSEPSTVAGGAVALHDKPAITADPTQDCVAYVVWVEQPTIFGPSDAVILFSRTDDCGRSWSLLPTPAIVRSLDREPWAPEVLVLADGTLLTMATWSNFDDEEPDALPDAIVVSRSEDGGETWSSPVTVAEFTPGPQGHDPETDENIKTQHTIASAEVGPDGQVHIAFHHETEGGAEQIRVVSSTDATAEEWREPTVVSAPGADPFLPVIAAAGNGALGVTYYDLRDDVPGDEPLTTHVFFAHSRDSGQTWHERRLAGPFDLRSGIIRRIPSQGYWVGEYHGLDGLPNGFAAAFPLAEPYAGAGATDVFFTKVSPTEGDAPPAATTERPHPDATTTSNPTSRTADREPVQAATSLPATGGGVGLAAGLLFLALGLTRRSGRTR